MYVLNAEDLEFVASEGWTTFGLRLTQIAKSASLDGLEGFRLGVVGRGLGGESTVPHSRKMNVLSVWTSCSEMRGAVPTERIRWARTSGVMHTPRSMINPIVVTDVE